MYYPSFEMFREKTRNGNLIPVYKEIFADMETPVSAFYKLKENPYAFLLESVEGGEKIGQYSFLGAGPSLTFQSKGEQVRIENRTTGEVNAFQSGDPLGELRKLMKQYSPVRVDGLPRFHGGAVGFISYDMVRFFEELPDTTEDDLGLPDCFFMLTDTILVFDHVNHKIKVVSNAHVNGSAHEAYQQARDKIDAIIDQIQRPLFLTLTPRRAVTPLRLQSNLDQKQFEENVRKAKEYITAGDIIQAVLSQRFSLPIAADPFEFYRALRTVNPSPYMYYLKLDDIQLAGSSPEVMVRVEDDIVQTRPIAGTRWRGATPEEDVALANELLQDPKECAEHVMLVDLGRNDLGRVCEYSSVRVDELMIIERYSHVMHIVSNVMGKLRKDKDAFDVVRACFPAGTLSGAPKIRAMEIIDELEPTRRGTYGGAVGYFSFSGNLDTAITIRTALVKDGIAYFQAGCGIVADSEPTYEYQESLNKAQAVVKAITLAENGLE